MDPTQEQIAWRPDPDHDGAHEGPWSPEGDNDPWDDIPYWDDSYSWHEIAYWGDAEWGDSSWGESDWGSSSDQSWEEGYWSHGWGGDQQEPAGPPNGWEFLPTNDTDLITVSGKPHEDECLVTFQKAR